MIFPSVADVSSELLVIVIGPRVILFAANFPEIFVCPSVCVKSIGLSVVPKVVVEFSPLPKETVFFELISQAFFIVVFL